MARRALTGRILVVNAGSSSLKLRVLEEGDRLATSVDLPALGSDEADDALAAAIRGFGQVDAVGHRVVHGGTEYQAAVVVDGGVRERLAALTDLAPLHQPLSIAGLDAVSAMLPHTPVIACFDTAFHATIPVAAATYALPRAWRERWPIRRFGFHGLSHAYASRRVAALWEGSVPRPFRLVTCHLGAGASLAAVLDGRSADTTMGFTPLAGLVMATRSGDVDPGLVLWVQQHGGLTAGAVADGLERESGLVGLAGSSDMRDVLAGAARGDGAATLALDVYLHRLLAGIGWMVASLGGLDALLFTGGVGEHAPLIRERTAAALDYLGVEVDAAANAADEPVDRELTAAGARVRTFVVEAREDLQVAAEVRALLAETSSR